MDNSKDLVRSTRRLPAGSLRRLSGKASVMAITASVSLVMLSSVSGAADAPAAPSATATTGMEEVIITGSSIKQRADTSSLPVTTLTAKDIAKTGLTSISDLVQNLPAMQNFVPASSSVNGGGGGATSAALHSLPSKYTTVLIDGQRVAGFALGSVQGGGSAVNLESIPLEAVERVEILTDGASALYGADAVAGVVNFILKKNRTDGNAFYHVSVPDKAGGGGWSAGLSKGFGDLGVDNYNLLFTYTHDVQDSLQAAQRDVSKRGGYFPFSSGGVNYILNQRTSNTEPGNIIVSQKGISYNPFYSANGNCGTPNAGVLVVNAKNTVCRFNFAATVQDLAPFVRDSGLFKGTFKVGDESEVWAEAMVSKFLTSPQFAPPAQPLGITPTRLPALWNTYVVGNPALAAFIVCTQANKVVDPVTGNLVCPAGSVSRATVGYRAVSAGGRTDDFNYQARHIAVGFNSKIAEWDISAAVIASHGKLTDNAAGGYLDFDQFATAVATGAYDPVLATGQSSIKSTILHTLFSNTFSDLNSLELNAQHKVLDLGGGASIVSVGAEFASARSKTENSDILKSGNGTSSQPNTTDTVVGGAGGAVDFEGDRTHWGLFGEWLLPFKDDLNVTASARYDSYSKTHSTTVYNTITPDPVTGLYPQVPAADLGNTFSKATYKVHFRYAPLEKLVFRGSIGTGFKAPEITDIAGTLSFAGSTSGTYNCPIPTSANCIPGSAQYDLLAGPNGKSGKDGLKPETSTQITFGVRVDPVPGLSLALDYWSIRLKDQIESTGIAEQVAFITPAQYQGLFVDNYLDPVGGFNTIALEQLPFNGGEAKYSGLDWHFNYRIDTAWGKFDAGWNGVQMLKQEYTNSPTGPTLTDLGVYGPDQAVVFRTISALSLSLQTGKWVNSLTAHYKSGYTDSQHIGDSVVYLAKPDGSLGAKTDFCCLKVPAYTSLDWQSTYDIAKAVGLTFGIKNLSDKEPPLSLQTGGGGNQIGYDGRYYDPLGRSYYLQANYKF